MKSQTYNLIRYDADEGKVFDWANLEEHVHEDTETGEVIQDHLYVQTLFIGNLDSIDNYVEVDAQID